jgi:hypothetical protein
MRLVWVGILFYRTYIGADNRGKIMITDINLLKVGDFVTLDRKNCTPKSYMTYRTPKPNPNGGTYEKLVMSNKKYDEFRTAQRIIAVDVENCFVRCTDGYGYAMSWLNLYDPTEKKGWFSKKPVVPVGDNEKMEAMEIRIRILEEELFDIKNVLNGGMEQED